MSKKGLNIIVVVIIAIILVNVASYYLLRWPPVLRTLVGFAVQRSQQRRALLLCKTDHQALLEAGREILSQAPKDRFNPQPDGKTYIGSFPVPKGRIPKIIRDLGPRKIAINYFGYMFLEMHGGMTHFGVRIYPKDFKKLRRNFKYGDRELLPGLWYYDDGYLHNPQYDKRIDEIIQKGTKR